MKAAEFGSLLSLLSLLLAGYGFFWSATKDDFDDLDLPPSELLQLSKASAAQKRRRLERLRGSAFLLALSPSVIVLLFASVAVEILQDVQLGQPYSPLRAGVLVVLVFWAALAAVMWNKLMRLSRQISALAKIENPQP